jgi:hypothetical protein
MLVGVIGLASMTYSWISERTLILQPRNTCVLGNDDTDNDQPLSQSEYNFFHRTLPQFNLQFLEEIASYYESIYGGADIKMLDI